MFTFRLLAAYSIKFELPFLKGSHQLGNCTGEEYAKWVEPVNQLVKDWVADPTKILDGALLTHSEFTLARLLAESISSVWDKHVLVRDINVPTTIRTTNRWGETVFRYMRQYLDRSQRTRMLMVEALVRAKRSAYRAEVATNPQMLLAVRKRARELIENPARSYSAFCKARLTALLDRNAREKAKQAVQLQEQLFLVKLQTAGLVPNDTKNITIKVLQEAVDVWRSKNVHISDCLRRSGTRESLMRQFTDDILSS